MLSRTIKLLHVEDELSQRRLLAHHLKTLTDFDFEILYADAEESALAMFVGNGVQLIILDYYLKQGNGLHCLEELRRRDQIVPIIAISGLATAEIAADLLQAGADDYIGKSDLTSNVLARILREALARADVWRNRDVRHEPSSEPQNGKCVTREPRDSNGHVGN
jgi:DNA-binding response OmpR family regulator